MPPGTEFIRLADFIELAVKFGLNLGVVYVIVRFLYRSTARSREYHFTYLLISAIIFLLCFLLESVKLELGLALGLFALFGILRYRTSQIPIKEMTYLFVVIGLSVINALTNDDVAYAEVIFTNIIVVALIALLERVFYASPEYTKTVVYENAEMLHPDVREELLDDLRRRTGLPVTHIEVDRIDYRRNYASLTVYYTHPQSNGDAGFRSE